MQEDAPDNTFDDEQEPPMVPLRSCGAPEPVAAPESPSETEEDAEPPHAVMSLGDHIAEMRSRLIICMLAIGITFLTGMAFYSYVWDLGLLPLTLVAKSLGEEPSKVLQLQSRGPMQAMIQVATIVLYLSLIITMPLTICQLWGFVSPALRKSERRAIVMIFSFGSLLFLTGVAVAYLFAIPVGLHFLIQFNRSLAYVWDLWTVDEYFGFLTMACFGFGVCFETPLVMLALAWAGLITPEGVIKYWRHAVLTMVVLGAVFTPPDPVTQIMLASMMAGLFFLGYWLMKLVVNRKEE